MRHAVAISLVILMSFGLAAMAAEKEPPPPRAATAAPRPQEMAPAVAPASGDAMPDDDKEGGKEESAGRGSSLPVPRFVSLRTDPVNLRAGPGERYPVEWVYVRRRLPVEVIAEFDTWRQIRDPGGTEGWVHQTMLSGRRTAMVTAPGTVLRREGADAATALANVERGVVVSVQRCPAGSDYCRVEASGIQGWLRRDQIWGVYPTETVQ